MGVSNWRLARAVSAAGGLGVISGTALDVILARRLQLGDPGGAMRRALDAFPFPEAARRIRERYFIPGGKAEDAPFAAVPLPAVEPSRAQAELGVAAAFAEVWLAKEGHHLPVGINLLEKIQLPTLLCLFGAMLAGVDLVLMGAGIPRQIPGILGRLAAGSPAELRLDAAGTTPGTAPVTRLDPAQFGPPRRLHRPVFLAVVTSPTLAMALQKKASGRVDGFIVEGPTAGGHNAPPRGSVARSATGEPIYGPRDQIDPTAFRALGLPFWLAGGYGRPGGLARARAEGAAGIQAGTVFAFCEESGIAPAWKRAVLERAAAGTLEVFTDPDASPTGFPFKVVRLPGTMADPAVTAARRRVCDLGFLRATYVREDGAPGFRCPGEPEADYLRKGGGALETAGRLCVCNGLFGTVGLAQCRSGTPEPALLTAGDDVRLLGEWTRGRGSYSAAEVVGRLMAA